MSLAARIVILLAIVGAIVAGWWRITVHYEQRGYDRAQAEYAQQAEAQRERNRELQRAAETRYTVQAGIREEFIVATVKEIRHVTQNLAACPVDPAAVRMLNDAATCAREDRPASCGAGEPVLGTR